MATKSIHGRYKVYKAGTKKVVDFLVSAGSKCADLKTVVKSLDCSLPFKSAKEPSNTSTANSEYGIRIHELLKLAHVIAATDPPLEVPEKVIENLKDVIAGRQSCADWYAAQALHDGGKLEEQNRSHRFFIEVLQRVLKLLTSARAKLSTAAKQNTSAATSKPKTKKNKNQTSITTASDAMGNLFDRLHVEEPSTQALGDQAHPPPYTASPLPDFKLEKEDDDSAFAVWCFLQDLNDVRSFVHNTWLEYSRGEISFLAASTVTDTAFGLLRTADAEFAATSSLESTSWDVLMNYLRIGFFTRNQAVWLCPARDVFSSGPRMPDSDINVVELLCPVALLCLLSYRRDSSEVCAAATARRKGQKNVAETKTSNMHGFHDFCCVLWKLAPQIHDIAHTQACEHVVIDEFVQGLAEIHRTGKMPMWTVVACQIYLDLYDLLGSHTSHGVAALQETFQQNMAVQTNILAFKAESNFDMEDVRSGLDTLCWVAKAANRFEQATRLPVEAHHELPSSTHARITEEIGCSASAMERALPAHTGAILADLKIGMHQAATTVGNHGHYILSAAHLYKGFRSMGVIEDDWHDMDMLLASCNADHPLVAKLSSPYDGDKAANKYLYALVIPLKHVADGRSQRNPGSRLALKDPRRITVTSPLLRQLSNRQQSWQKCGLGYSKSKTVEIVLHALTASADDSKGNKSIRHKSQLRETFTPLQLLTTFKKCFIADESQLNFDYISFMIDCARLLSTIGKEVETLLKCNGHSMDYVPLVATLLSSSASDPPVLAAAASMKSYITNRGKHFSKQAYDQTSGCIPKNMRPKLQLDFETVKEGRAMMCTMFDYADTKYTFYGRAMAAYHPRIKPEMCDSSCPGGAHGPGGGHIGGETDPNAHHHHGKKILSYGSALPAAIVEEGLANAEKDRTKFVAARDTMLKHLFKQHAKGQVPEKELRETVRNVLGFELEVLDPAHLPKDATPWAYRLLPTDAMYGPMFEFISMTEGAPMTCQGPGKPIIASVDFLTHEVLTNLKQGL